MSHGNDKSARTFLSCASGAERFTTCSINNLPPIDYEKPPFLIISRVGDFSLHNYRSALQSIQSVSTEFLLLVVSLQVQFPFYICKGTLTNYFSFSLHPYILELLTNIFNVVIHLLPKRAPTVQVITSPSERLQPRSPILHLSRYDNRRLSFLITSILSGTLR